MTRLIQIADIHFGREDPAAINAAGDLISSLDPDGLLVCGDLTQRGKRSEFEAAAEWLHPWKFRLFRYLEIMTRRS